MHALLFLLRDLRAKLAEPGHDYTWSSWIDQDDALAEIDACVNKAMRGRAPRSLGDLFAPTGPLQELAISSGWGDEYLKLADRYDAAMEVVPTNACNRDGWVVGSRALPTDPTDRDGSVRPVLGCSRIACIYCKQDVRTVAGYDLKDQASTFADWRPLYEALAASPLLVESKPSRLYVCHCAYHVETGESPLDDDEGIHVATERRWTCGGHPAVELPHRFDGVWVTAENLEAVVTDVVRGTAPADLAPPPPREKERAEVWLARLTTRLAGTSYQRRAVDAVAALLTDADEATRVRAIRLFADVPEHSAAMRADRLMGEHAALFVGVANPWSGIAVTKTLDQVIWRTCGRDLPTDVALRDVAHACALDPRRASRALFIALALHDARWLIENAAALRDAHPERREEIDDAVSLARRSGPTSRA